MAMESPIRLLMHFLAASPFLSIAVLVILTTALYKYQTYDNRLKCLPPRVKAWPIINHTFMHLKDDGPPMVTQWARDYGELFYTKAGTTQFIWLNTHEAVKELYDRRSAIYSSRQPMPMALDAATHGQRITLMPYGPRWRTARSIIHKILTPKMADEYQGIQIFESKQLMVDLLDSPEDFYMHNRRYSVSVILQVVYGRRAPRWDCDDVRDIFAVMERFVQVRRPGQWLVDVIPELSQWKVYNIFSKWQSVGQIFYQLDRDIFMTFWERMKKDVNAGKAPHCFGKEFISSNYKKHGIDEEQAAYIAGAMIEAGSETTSAALNNCILGLLSNPEAIVRAHKELDRVVGQDRTPDYDDERNLPFIRGIVKETLRFRPVNKFGNNHCATQDDWYNGYFIPKGTVVMANWWAIHFNPEQFPEPDKFKPERYINFKYSAAEAAARPDGKERDHLSYGGGRRICLGIHLAEKSLFMNIARLLWGFDLDLATGLDGEKIQLDFKTTNLLKGSGTVAKPYQCSLTPRSAKHEALYRKEWAEAQEKGIDFSHIKFQV